MTPIGKTSSRRNSFAKTKHTRDTETSQCLSPQCTKKIECCVDIEPIPLHTRKISNSTVQMYLRIKPVVKEDNVYNILTETTISTKFPSFENNIRNSKSAKSSEVTSRRHVFTKIFGSETSQAEMFERSIKHRVAQLLDGKSSTIMTYGTRDSGKTYTLFGTSASPGIIPRSIELVFSTINCTLTPWYKPTCRNTVIWLDETAQTEETRWKTRVLRSMDVNQIYAEARRSLNNLEPENADPEEECHGESMYAVWVSFAEIYNGNIYDLLDDTEEHSPLRLTANSEGRSYVCSLRRVHVITALEACQIVLAGQSRMSTAATPSNPKSSRSHTIFTMTLLRYQKNRAPDDVVLSTLAFCDLAGSTQFKTHQERSQTREASNINNSLLVLGRCLKAVSQNRVAPFRDSKLTRIFQRALSGQESLSFIVNVAFTSNLLNGEVQNTFAFCATVRKLLIDVHGRRERSCEVDNRVLNADSDVITPPSVHQTRCLLAETAETSGRVDSAAYKNLQEENTRLTKELKATKSDILNREYAIRQELADHYSRVIQDLEATYKDHAKQIENEERDLLKWSVKQIEDFYEERIDNLIRRKKRKREDGDDYIENNRTLHAELGAENTQVTSEVLVLKDAVKKLRKENKAILCERNKCCFELALITDELKKFRQFTQAGIRKWGGNSGNIDDDAECLVNNLERLMDEKLKRTEKTLEEMNKYIGAIKNKDAEDAATNRELPKSQNLLDNALMKITELEKELTRKDACIVALKLQTEIQEKQFTKVQERDPQNKSVADKLDEWLNVSTLFPSQNQLVAESTKKTFLNISDIDRKSFFESSVDCSVISRSSDRSSKDDSGVSSGLRDGRSTSVSDSTNIRENEDKCTQTCFVENDSRITTEESNVVRRETTDCANSKRQNHKETSHIDELSQNLETIGDVISALNEAACVNERNIIRHECELMHKEDVLKLTEEEKKKIAICKTNDLPEAKDKMEMYELSELTSKLRSKEENKNRTFKRLESYVDFNFFENKISLMRDQLDKASGKCLNEHLPRIESLEEKLLRKSLRINELEEKIAQMRDGFSKGYELFEKIRDFEIIVSRWQRDRNNLYKRLCECTEDQLNLEEKLKRLTIKLAERGSEVISLKSQVRGITDSNTTNGVKVRNLNDQVAEAVESISLIKTDLQCCKDLRKNIENVMKMEIDDLRSWLSDYENNTKFLNKICKIYDDSRDEITSLRMQLQHKELEIALLTSDRDVAIQKHEILTNDLRKEIEEKIKHNKTVANSSEEFLIKNNAICEIIDSGKIASNENERQSREPLKVRESNCSLANGVCSTSKDARSEVVNVSSASSENFTTSFDDKDDADSKIINDSCQDRNVTLTLPFVCETNHLELELYFDLKSSNKKRKEFDWIEIRKIEVTKPTLSQLFRNSNSDPESE
ncbi:kinesin-like protein KIF20A [Pseudomyrmex gracilis]|uniref:kinesin-like protein KIF20A n=1 Tax=Pseudomyrmex gracilis TaxID=219809 RepID=UPI000995C936|nr:kinesin-like protein KIF20A [Pseudomyrmex gracilis]